MDIKQLQAFKAVIEHQSVTKAARFLGVTQPAVSSQIARLEAELGFALFSLVGRRVQPTPEGLILFDEVTNTLHGMEKLTQLALDIRQVRMGQLTIASHPWAAISLLPQVAAQMLRSRKQVKIRFVTRTSDALRDLMQVQAFDIGVVEPPVDPAFVRASGRKIRCVALLPKGHRLEAHDEITPSIFSGERFVASFRGHGTHYEIVRAFERAKAQLNVCVEAQFGITICSMVAQGAGVSICDPFSAAMFSDRELTIRPFSPLIEYEFAVIHPAQREPSLLAKEFLRALDGQIDKDLEKFALSVTRKKSRTASNL